MTRFVRRAAVLAALVAAPVLAVAGPAFAAESGHATGTKPVAVDKVAVDKVAYENQVVALTNVQRKAHGCGALRNDSRLAQSARAHSTDMVKQGFFSHTGSSGSSFVAREISAGYPKKGPSAENIAWGFRTPQDVVTGWMNSPGHRANILNCGSVAVGVGLAYTSGGSAYWTQDFGRI
ncbi:CAP domain-containing protein [Actinoplanes sp. NPDC051343]|uniref:CAP domain-containing protein n=1 Tax=Actinoplanes sp. NPDC051343 TaxID=3363906 RepID=UPI00379F3FCB